MTFNNKNRNILPRLGGCLLIIGGIAYLGYWQAQAVIFGPQIELNAVATTTEEPVVEVSGQADNVRKIYINGRSVNLTPEGGFKTSLPLSGRYNTIKVQGEDEFGNQKKLEREIYYTGEPPYSTETDWEEKLERLQEQVEQNDQEKDSKEKNSEDENNKDNEEEREEGEEESE